MSLRPVVLGYGHGSMRPLAVALLLVSSLAAAQESWVEDCGLQPPGSVPFVPLPLKDWEPQLTADSPPLVRLDRPEHRIGGTPAATVRGVGALANKVVYLSPGHGFTWDSANAAWRTQRGTTNAVVEDLVSIETLSQYLMPMLLNAGARVVPVRELDLNTNLVIVDNGEAGYAESGPGFTTSTLMGWGRPALPMSGAALPFSLGTNRLLASAATVTASATYTANIPADGYYDVQVSYTAFSARVTDAHYVVRHAGGETSFRVNQQRHGGTWVQLGRFYFRRGGPAQVVVQNDSSNAVGSNISLDAVKFGGGNGLVDRGAGVSGRPRFEESARYHAQWAGAPTSVWAPSSNTPDADRNNDISTRSRFSAWVHEPGEDAVYVAWHTNAGGGRGTETYVYGTNPPDGTMQFSGVDGGVQLANAIHDELINDFRQDAGLNQPTWGNRRVRSAYFGEINPSNNGEMPSTLVELAFHDSVADAAFLREPTFRYHAARAIAQGIIRYFAQKDGVAVVFPPEPPTQVSVVAQGGGAAQLKWRASSTDGQGVRGQQATGYRVYSSPDGLAWDDGVTATGTSASVAASATAARYYRVTATNAGGESFPSAVVGVRAAAPGRPRALVVNGFDRLEAATGKTETFPSRYALGNVLRVFIERMNDGSAARLTGQALDANDVGFDTAETDAAVAGDVPLAPYELLAWFVGRGKQGGAGLTSAEQGVITSFRNRNAPVFFTGAPSADAAFVSARFSGTLGAAAGGSSFDTAGPFAGLTGLVLDDGTAGSFDTGATLAVSPAGAAVQLASYGSTGAAVGVPAQTVFFGFPFETVVGQPVRVELMRRVLGFLLPGATFPDAGVVTPPVDAGVPVDAGTVIDAGVPVEPDGGVQPDAGLAPDGGVISPADGGVSEPPGDGGVVRQQLLAFQGGGCSSTPLLVPLLALLVFRSARKRRSDCAS